MKIFENTFPPYEDLQILGMLFTFHITPHTIRNVQNSCMEFATLKIEASSLIDTTAKCRHLLKLTCKWTLRQVFIRFYRLEIHLVMLLFFTQLCKLLPL